MTRINMYYTARHVARIAEGAWRRTLSVSKIWFGSQNSAPCSGRFRAKAISLRRGGLGIWR